MDNGSESLCGTAASIEEIAGRTFEIELIGNVHYLDHPSVIHNDIGPIGRRLPQVRSFAAESAAVTYRQGEFLAAVSHELRSPLAAIRNAAYVLGMRNAAAAARQKARTLIEHQVVRMTRLVDDLLEASRIGNGRICLQRERLDLRCVLQYAIETVESNLGERKHRFAIVMPDVPVWLQADPGRLEQVFVNLLVNAAKYTDAGGDLSLSLQQEQGQAIVRVRDSGIGIAPDMLPRIFGLFVQVDRSARHSEAGLGIGLALARSFVELHGGSIHVESAGLGQGSEFIVCLPVA